MEVNLFEKNNVYSNHFINAQDYFNILVYLSFSPFYPLAVDRDLCRSRRTLFPFTLRLLSTTLKLIDVFLYVHPYKTFSNSRTESKFF